MAIDRSGAPALRRSTSSDLRCSAVQALGALRRSAVLHTGARCSTALGAWPSSNSDAPPLSFSGTRLLRQLAAQDLGCFGYYSCARLFRISGPMLSDARALRQSACRVLCCSAALLLVFSSARPLRSSACPKLDRSGARLAGLSNAPRSATQLLRRSGARLDGPSSALAIGLPWTRPLWRSAALLRSAAVALGCCGARLVRRSAALLLGFFGAQPLSRSAAQ
jgi:hypothetical protein